VIEKGGVLERGSEKPGYLKVRGHEDNFRGTV
jgi:hypothetical protein